MKPLFYIIILLVTINCCSCDGCATGKSGATINDPAVEERVDDTETIAERYSVIDKKCTRLEQQIQDVSPKDALAVEQLKRELAELLIKAKDLQTDFEANSLGKNKNLEQLIDYGVVESLAKRIEKLQDSLPKDTSSEETTPQ
jgi:hypothetical protein